jgi:RNA polymerase sigma factor (sigma-70 family)
MLLSMDTIHDQELIARCVTGRDDDAWELFVRRYSRLIWSSIHKTFRFSSFLYSQEDVEDVYSSVFLSLLDNDYVKLRMFESRNACTLSTWLAVVTVNRTIDYLRKQKLSSKTRDEDSSPLEDFVDRRESVETLLMEKQKNDAFGRAVAALSEQDRQVYNLLYIHGFSPDKAAHAMGLSLTAFYTKKHRLIEKIKKSLPAM